MSTQSEKSPLTQNASGRENGTEFEARGLFSADNGTASENLSLAMSPAPEQASEAADQRPRTEESPAAEGILDASAVGGNGTSSKVSHVDALTPEKIRELKNLSSDPRLHESERAAIRAILAARLVEQHEAAPADERIAQLEATAQRYQRMVDELKQRLHDVTHPELTAAGERAALPRYIEWLHLRTHGEWSSGVPEWARDHTGRMNDFTAASAVIEELAARASSPNAAEPVAWVRKHPDTGELSGDWLWNDAIEQCRKDSGVWFPLGFVAAPPPPAPVGLTGEQRALIEHAEERLRGRGPDDIVAANGLLEVLTAPPGQPEPRAEVKATVAVALYDEARELLYGNLDTLRWAIELADATGNCSQARGLEAVEYQIRRLFGTARAGESQ